MRRAATIGEKLLTLNDKLPKTMSIDPTRIFAWTTQPKPEDFEQTALAYFRHQATFGPVYRQYLNIIGKESGNVRNLADIPFLPIEFFKSREILCDSSESRKVEIVFSSSGTTGAQASRHVILDLELYRKSFRTAFSHFYGGAENRVLLALLPSYQERTGSSLIFMVDDLIQQSNHPESGYFLDDHERLHETLQALKQRRTPTLLLGVTYALLDYAEAYSIQNFEELIVMETGGMKGRRREMVREEVHQILGKAFDLPTIHSEYGMTELLSQAYSTGNGRFRCPPWMQIQIRDINDPFSLLGPGRTGGINIIDLANFYSCSFIATQDLGRVYEDGTFEVLGRFDHSDIRGCNLLVP